MAGRRFAAGDARAEVGNAVSAPATAAAKALFPVLLALVLATAAPAAETDPVRIDTVVVSAKHLPDLGLERAVEHAFEAHPYLASEHLSVSVNNGVLRLRGFVQDEWDMQVALRIARRTPGVRRVINEAELSLGGE
jgi:hypothetical protein